MAETITFPTHLVAYELAPEDSLFCPMSKEKQLELCRLLCLPFCKQLAPSQPIQKLPEIGPLTFSIPGCGNCLFSSLSSAVTGCIKSRFNLRKMVCDGIVANESIVSHLLERRASGAAYLRETKMRKKGTWGGDLEILSFRRLTDCVVFLLSFQGWIRFSRHRIISFDMAAMKIYLVYKNGNNYEPVTLTSIVRVSYDKIVFNMKPTSEPLEYNLAEKLFPVRKCCRQLPKNCRNLKTTKRSSLYYERQEQNQPETSGKTSIWKRER